MAISAAKTWIAGEVLTALDLNAEFANIYGAGQDAWGWPATTEKDLDGQVLWLDSDKDSSITADTDDRMDIALSGADLFRFDGTVATPVNGIDFIASATGSDVSLTMTSSADSDRGLNIVPLGTGTLQQGGTRVLLLGEEASDATILAGQVFG
jgi:hypothetical protein